MESIEFAVALFLTYKPILSTEISLHSLIFDLAPSRTAKFGLVRQHEILTKRFQVSLHVLLQNQFFDKDFLIMFILSLIPKSN